MNLTPMLPGKDGWTEWIQPVRRGYRAQCCRCKIVHVIDARVRYGRAQFRARLLRPEEEAARR